MSDPVGYFEDRQEPDNKMFVDAGSSATDIPLHKRHIFVNGNSPQTPINLPNVSEAEGAEFIVEAINVPGTTKAGVKVDYSDGSDETLEKSIETSELSLRFNSNGRSYNVGRRSSS